MSRLSPLMEEAFDVLVLGAGIHGATLACAASCAGLRVALIDAGDYGSGASANSLKILHGGLRYLQQLNFPRMRESIRARREGVRHLPYLAHPASFVVPAGGGLTKSLLAYHAAARINDVLGWDRNRGLPSTHLLPATSVWSRRTFRERCPIPGNDRPGAMQWSDGFIENTERYTLAYALTARDRGAIIRNYVRAQSLIRAGSAVVGARVRDEESGETGNIRAAVTVNAAGAWAPALCPEPKGATGARAWTRAYNLVVARRWFGSYGVGLKGAGAADVGRMFFFAPWRDTTLVGTVYLPHDPEHDTGSLQPGEIASFVSDINRIFPPAELTVREVVSAHVGVLPARHDRRGRPRPEPAGTTRILDGRKRYGLDGYMEIVGVKYTTAWGWAERLTRELLRRGKHPPRDVDPAPLYGAERPVAAADIRREAARSGWALSEAAAGWLAEQYGSRYGDVLAEARAAERLRDLLPGSVVPVAAAAHAAACEDARHLDDFLFRRTDLGTRARLSPEVVRTWCDRMAPLYGWDSAARTRECARVHDHYRRLGLAS